MTPAVAPTTLTWAARGISERTRVARRKRLRRREFGCYRPSERGRRGAVAHHAHRPTRRYGPDRTGRLATNPLLPSSHAELPCVSPTPGEAIDNLRVEMCQLPPLLGARGRNESSHLARLRLASPRIFKQVDSSHGQLRESQNRNPRRQRHDLLTYSCVHFTKEVVAAAGIETPWMLDPRPNSYIGEFRDDYPDLDYYPRTRELKIEARAEAA